MSDIESSTLFLELGDIIKINSTTNEELDQHVFFIDYLDNSKVKLIDEANLSKVTLKITNGEFNDKSIQSIEILSRSEVKGYARQNDLLPNKHISIRFGGDIPAIINGRISNLENDMIELTTYPEGEKIYIDFAYKGIPENLPIESITEFVKPESKLAVEIESEETGEDEKQDGEDGEEGDEALEIDDDEDMEIQIGIPIPEVKERIKKMIISADEIEFGEDLGSIEEFVPVKESEQRYGIDTQTNDLLDEMLSTIPSSERSRKVLNSIHIMIERFKQLREKYSEISPQGEVIMAKKKGADFKPLVESLETMNHQLYWLLPIVKNRKKIYDLADRDEEERDIIQVSLKNNLENIEEIVAQYKENRVPDGQNKYKYMVKEVELHDKPFSLPYDNTNVIKHINITNNINCVIDNLSDFYSSIATKDGVLDRTRYLIDKYNLGSTYLETKEENKKKEWKPFRVNITQNDKAALTGLMVLEEPALLYSHINLPNTNIMSKAHLALVTFNFWSILKKNTELVTHDISLDKEVEEIEDTFLSQMDAFMFKERMNFDDRSEGVYKEFLNRVIPRTRRLFEIVKKYMKDATSYLKIIEYLEPFLVYPDDISFKQYETILEFMRTEINNYKKKIVTSEVDINSFLSIDYENRKQNILKDIIEDSRGFIDAFLHYDGIIKDTTDEAIKKIITIDNGRLFTSIISKMDSDLYQPVDIEEIIKNKLSEDPGEKESSGECGDLVLAKQYIDIDELREDDGNIVYFDKKYDTTRYDILEELKEEKQHLSSEDFKMAVISHLINGVGMTEEKALIEAESMIEGERRVRPGDYAIIYDQENKPVYFKRNEVNTWERDDSLTGRTLSNVMFCNVKESCISIKKKCGPIEINRKEIEKNLFKEILSQFDEKFHKSIEQIKRTINDNYNYNLSNIFRLKMVKMRYDKKNQDKKLKIGEMLEDRDIVTSPYEELRNVILSQQDFVKKQRDIISFCEKYTRVFNEENPDENKYWFYCTTSNLPLIPTFYNELARSFFSNMYRETLEQIKAERGKLSDDGDKVVDKFSGYIIDKIDYDDSEGYDEQGFKIVSRDVLEADIEKVVAGLDFKIPDTMKSQNSKMIINIVKTLDSNIGIRVDSQIEFIINLVNSILNKYMPSKKDYDRAVSAAMQSKKGKKKKMPTYEQAYNEALIIYTLGAYLVSVQTMIPSIRTRRTFPTCSRSFSGYPLAGDSETTGLEYICCTALNIARESRDSPWDRLPKIRSKKAREIINKFKEKVKKNMDKYIVTNSEVVRKISEKTSYLATKKEDEEIPNDFNVKKWTTFLPPLTEVKIKNIRNITPSFKSDLMTAMRNSNPIQFQKLSMIQSKDFFFSLHIQELIQRVVDKEELLLQSNGGITMVQNACCNDNDKNTLEYFTEKESSIVDFINIVKNNSEILNKASNLVIPNFLLNDENTRLIFPELTKLFSETTIYQGFIKFCGYNTGIMLDGEMDMVCGTNMSDFKPTDTISEKIRILKHEGKNYSMESFYQLLMLVNSKNRVFINFNPVIKSKRLEFDEMAEKFSSKVEDPFLSNIIQSIKSLYDTYDLVSSEYNESLQTIKTNLLENMDILLNQKIIPYLSRYGVDEKYLDFIKNIEKFKTRGDDIYISREDETSFASSEYLKRTIFNIMELYPEIILNDVNYSNISLPKHWDKLASSHKSDVSKFISAEFMGLQQFYHDSEIKNIVREILEKNKILLKMVDLMPFYANIRKNYNGFRVKTVLNGELLEKFMKLYFLVSLNSYIDVVTKNLEAMQEISKEEDSSILDVEVKENILRGREKGLQEKNVSLITTYLDMAMSNKKIINISNDEVKEAILKAKEREKTRIVERLGELNPEELEVEDLQKQHKLGVWGLGLTRALYEYDKDQYDKERAEYEKDELERLHVNREGPLGLDERNNNDMILMDMEQENRATMDRIAESNAIMAQMAEDDDFGDMDGDEMF